MFQGPSFGENKEHSWETQKRSMGPVLIWPNIITVVNILLQEILALTRLQHILSNERILEQKKI